MNQLGYLYRYILEIIYLNINLMETKEKVLATMKAAGEPLNAGKIAELSGLDRKEVDKAMKQLKEEGAIVSPVRCKWAPAE
jgi:biotin operon repressor